MFLSLPFPPISLPLSMLTPYPAIFLPLSTYLSLSIFLSLPFPPIPLPLPLPIPYPAFFSKRERVAKIPRSHFAPIY